MQLCDVTLREGDQMPGRSYSAEQKFEAGLALDRLGLAFIQAGFPITGEKDQMAIRELASTTDADIIGLARATTRDVDAALDAEADVVEVFIPFGDRLLEHMLGKSREQAREMLVSAVTYATDHGVPVHVSLVDAFRTDQKHLIDVFEAVSDVEYVNFADTVGARVPAGVTEFLTSLSRNVDLSRVGVHFHDDMGVATANVLAAYKAGVGKADVSVASLGERAGNPALEEVLVAGVTGHGNAFSTRTDTLIPVCTEVLKTLDEDVQPRKAVLGSEVSEHESGLHTATMLDDPGAFEPFDPKSFGGQRRLLFGEATGKMAARKLLARADIEATDERVRMYLDALSTEGPLTMSEAVDLATERFA